MGGVHTNLSLLLYRNWRISCPLCNTSMAERGPPSKICMGKAVVHEDDSTGAIAFDNDRDLCDLLGELCLKLLVAAHGDTMPLYE